MKKWQTPILEELNTKMTNDNTFDGSGASSSSSSSKKGSSSYKNPFNINWNV